MTSRRASIFEEPDELDVSGFTPKTTAMPAPPPEAVREVSEAAKFRSREPAKHAIAAAPPPPKFSSAITIRPAACPSLFRALSASFPTTTIKSLQRSASISTTPPNRSFRLAGALAIPRSNMTI